MGVLQELAAFWKTIVIIGTPLVLLPFVLVYPEPEVQCGYVILVMAIYWMTAVIPMGITGLLPVIMFPMFGLIGVVQVATNYIKSIHLLLIGSMLMALAVEQHGLHRRMALKSLLIIGTSPRRLLFGLMFVSWFLSFWLPNVAVTAMMVPVIDAIVKELRAVASYRQRSVSNLTQESKEGLRDKEAPLVEKHDEPPICWHINKGLDTDGDDDAIVTISYAPSVPDGHACALPCSESKAEKGSDEFLSSKGEEQLIPESAYLTNVAAMMAIAVSYASNIGGIATLIGTNPNLLLFEKMESVYKCHGEESPLTYAMWIPMGLPSAAIAFILCYILLQIYFLRRKCCPGSEADDLGDKGRIKAALQEQCASLGGMKWGEVSTLIFFIILILLLFFREPGFMDGYSSLFSNPKMLADAVPAMLIATLLYIFPSKKPKLFCLRSKNEKPESVPALLEWKTSGSRLPWSALLLIGGAFAIEMGSRESGLSKWLEERMTGLSGLSDTAVLVICMLLITIFTNITCGMATSSVFLPIYINMGYAFGIHPMYLTAGSCLMASSTFMLPASNPTNAIMYDSGYISILDMAGMNFSSKMLSHFGTLSGFSVIGLYMVLLPR